MISKGEWLCNSKKILINSKAVNNRYIMKPYDLVTFLFRKSLIRAKQYRFFYKKQNKGSKLKIRKGLIHNKQCNFFILYKNINFMRRSKSKYLFYYYFYRNLLQTCRMR